jgi:hypothetical protein
LKGKQKPPCGSEERKEKEKGVECIPPSQYQEVDGGKGGGEKRGERRKEKGTDQGEYEVK